MGNVQDRLYPIRALPMYSTFQSSLESLADSGVAGRLSWPLGERVDCPLTAVPDA